MTTAAGAVGQIEVRAAIRKPDDVIGDGREDSASGVAIATHRIPLEHRPTPVSMGLAVAAGGSAGAGANGPRGARGMAGTGLAQGATGVRAGRGGARGHLRFRA